MGLNDEYSRDAYNYDGNAYDSDGSDDVDLDLHPEDWQDMYSQELLDGWMIIREYAESRYMTVRATYTKFVELVLDSNRWHQDRESSAAHLEMWNLVSNLPVISDRVQAANFYAWAEKYIGYL